MVRLYRDVEQGSAAYLCSRLKARQNRLQQEHKEVKVCRGSNAPLLRAVSHICGRCSRVALEGSLEPDQQPGQASQQDCQLLYVRTPHFARQHLQSIHAGPNDAVPSSQTYMLQRQSEALYLVIVVLHTLQMVHDMDRQQKKSGKVGMQTS